jgi:NTF2 fold immunity protein of polymorphic toxin system component
MKGLRQQAILLAIAVAACQGGSDPRIITDVEAIDIADVYVAKNYPMAPRHILQPIAHDQGETWLVTYRAPPDSGGGTPVIEIDKRTSRVVHAHHGQ